MLTRIILKKNEERRLLSGHQWIFSNEIAQIEDLAEDMCIASLFDFRGKFLGKGFYNKHSLISFRYLTHLDEEIDERFIFKRLSRANALRKRFNSEGSVYRLCNGESDFLPGLIIDKFDDKYSIQIFSAGMELLLQKIVNVLKENFKASLIVEKNMNSMRELEGLKKKEGILFDASGTGETSFTAEVDSIKYRIDLSTGQKSGFYLDQNANRKLIRSFVKQGDSVLDLFCNDGGFALNAAISGAEEITAVDASDKCIENVKGNFGLNGHKVPETHSGDCFDFINSLFQTKRKFDLIILDPPSLTKSKKNVSSALRAYKELNYKCIKLVKPDGMLFTFTCSHHISERNFEEMLISASSKAGKTLQLVSKSVCSYDHPVLVQMPETLYLKGYLMRVI